MSSIGEAEDWEAVEREDELLPEEDALPCLTPPVSAPAPCPVLSAAAAAAVEELKHEDEVEELEDDHASVCCLDAAPVAAHVPAPVLSAAAAPPAVDDDHQSLLPDTDLPASPVFEHAPDIVRMEDPLQVVVAADSIVSTIGEEDPLPPPAEQGPGAFQIPHPPAAAAESDEIVTATQLVDLAPMDDPVQQEQELDNPTPLHSLTEPTEGEDIPHPISQEAPKAPEASLTQAPPNNPTEQPVPAAAPNNNDVLHPTPKDAPKEPANAPQASKVDNPPNTRPEGPTNTAVSAPAKLQHGQQAKAAKAAATHDKDMFWILLFLVIASICMITVVPAMLYYELTAPNRGTQQQLRLASSAELLQQWYQQHQSCGGHHAAAAAAAAVDLTNAKPPHSCPAPGGLPLPTPAREFQLTTNNGKSCLSSAHGLGQQLTLVACSSGTSLLEQWRERRQHQLFTVDDGRIVSAKGRYCLQSQSQVPGAAAFKLAPCADVGTRPKKETNLKTFQAQQWVFSSQGDGGGSLQISPLTAPGLCVEVAQGYRPGCHLLPGTFEQELVLGSCSKQEDQAFAPAYAYPLP